MQSLKAMLASPMATLTIRQIDAKTIKRHRIRAAHHGCSMEEEAKEILRVSLNEPPQQQEDLAERIGKLFAPGIKLELPEREPPDFG